MRADLVYFANLEGREYLDALVNKLNTYRNFLGGSGLASRWANSLGAYYGYSTDGKNSWRVTPGGEFGELVQGKVNEYASIVRHEVVLAVQNRPAGIAQAVNTEVKTLRNSHIGTQLVEYYLQDPAHEFEKDYVQALEIALLTAEAFVVQDWDTTRGPETRPDEYGNPMFLGDITQDVYGIWDSATDIGCPNGNNPWRIFSKRVNKYEFAAKFKAYEEEILLNRNSSSMIRPPVLFRLDQDNSDFIEAHKFIHLPTIAVPKGRYTIFINDQIVLDVAFPYPGKNFHRVIDREMFGTAFAHTSNYDLLGLEQVTDALHSTIITNQTTFGVSTIVGPKGAGVSQTELAKGLRYIELDPQFVDKLKPLQLTSTPPEIFNYNQYLSKMKGQLSGINSVVKGDPEGQLRAASGSALALLTSQAIQYNSGVQTSFYRLLSKAGTGLIDILRENVEEPRIGKIVGKANAQAVKEFKYDRNTLDSVSTVIFQPVNPILQTPQGKATLAKDLLDAGLIQNPRRYIEVLTTGNVNVLLEDELSLEEVILEENEHLADGIAVEALVIEHHENHIKGHQSVIAKPNAKSDPELVARVLAHIQQHTNQWRELSINNPALLLATGQKVLPLNPMEGGMPPGGAPAPGGPVPNPPEEAPMPMGNQPELPAPPKNPMTGEDFQLEPGTAAR